MTIFPNGKMESLETAFFREGHFPYGKMHSLGAEFSHFNISVKETKAKLSN